MLFSNQNALFLRKVASRYSEGQLFELSTVPLMLGIGHIQVILLNSPTLNISSRKENVGFFSQRTM